MHYSQNPTPPKIISETEWELLLDAAHRVPGRSGIRGVAMLVLMRRAGLRKSELTGLRVEDVHLDHRYPRVEVRKSKFDKSRNVPIDPRIMPLLVRWFAEHPTGEGWFFCTLSVRGAVAKGNPVGSQLSKNYVWEYLQRVCKKAGVRPIRPHWLRHTCATDWLRNGLSLEDVRILLGHEHLHTTQRYLHVDRIEIARKIASLGGVIDPLPTLPSKAVVSPPEPLPALNPGRGSLPLHPLIRPLTAPPAQAPVSEDRACPYCAETVKAAAVFCRHCRTPLIA